MKSVLAIGAHPGDVECHAGATLAALVREGAQLTLVVVTDGERGEGSPPNLAQIRRLESERASDMLGAQERVFLGRPDGELVNDERLRRDLVQEIRIARAELVLVHDPTTFWIAAGRVTHLGHSDHRATGQATLDAIHPRASSRSFYPSLAAAGYAPWLVRELWLFDTLHPDHWVDVSRGRDAKNAALACHESQNAMRLVEEAEEEAEAHIPRAEFPAEAFRRLILA